MIETLGSKEDTIKTPVEPPEGLIEMKEMKEMLDKYFANQVPGTYSIIQYSVPVHIPSRLWWTRSANGSFGSWGFSLYLVCFTVLFFPAQAL
jgi:hypothetical protein